MITARVRSFEGRTRFHCIKKESGIGLFLILSILVRLFRTQVCVGEVVEMLPDGPMASLSYA